MSCTESGISLIQPATLRFTFAFLILLIFIFGTALPPSGSGAVIHKVSRVTAF